MPMSSSIISSCNNNNWNIKTLRLVAWLFELNDSNVGDYASYDDPISVASNICNFQISVLTILEFELKKMGIECDFPPVKLKAGAGE